MLLRGFRTQDEHLLPIHRNLVPRSPPRNARPLHHPAIGHDLVARKDAVRQRPRRHHLPRLALHQELELLREVLPVTLVGHFAFDVEFLGQTVSFGTDHDPQ